MLTTSSGFAPLTPRSAAVRATPMPLAANQRPFVLMRPRQAPQQLSLFGPPGATRR